MHRTNPNSTGEINTNTFLSERGVYETKQCDGWGPADSEELLKALLCFWHRFGSPLWSPSSPDTLRVVVRTRRGPTRPRTRFVIHHSWVGANRRVWGTWRSVKGGRRWRSWIVCWCLWWNKWCVSISGRAMDCGPFFPFFVVFRIMTWVLFKLKSHQQNCSKIMQNSLKKLSVSDY